MGKIINFWEAKRAIEMRELKERLEYEWEEERKKYWAERKEREIEEKIQTAIQSLPKPPRKKAKIISALPGEAIPPEFVDLRRYMQRDGLILLTWSLHEKDGYPHYNFNWVKSCGKLKKYSGMWYTAKDLRTETCKMFTGSPMQKFDKYYREGIIGNNYEHGLVVDYLFICAPELTALTRPSFIEKLKQSGVNVDFDYDFSLGKAKEIEFQKQVAEIEALGSAEAKSV